MIRRERIGPGDLVEKITAFPVTVLLERDVFAVGKPAYAWRAFCGPFDVGRRYPSHPITAAFSSPLVAAEVTFRPLPRRKTHR